MKNALSITFISLLLSYSAWAMPCTDFSGRYESVTEDPKHEDITITQSTCGSVDLEYSYDGVIDVKSIQLDHLKRKIYDTPDVRSWQTAYFDGDARSILIEIENSFRGGPVQKSVRRLSVETSNGLTYLLDGFGKLTPDGVYHPNRNTTWFLKK